MSAASGRAEKAPRPKAPKSKRASTAFGDLRLGAWQTALADVAEVDSQIGDNPYGVRAHSSEVGDRNDGFESDGLVPTYEAWTRDHVFEFVRSWSPRTRQWMANITSHDLIPDWEDAYRDVGRYAFAPVGIVIKGMSFRKLGDGPSSWTLHLMAARPKRKEFMGWGCLDGGYTGVSSKEAGGGRGKPAWLMQALVRDYSRRGDLVADALMGWGATGEACAALSRRFVGSELDPAAYAEAERRLSRMQQVDLLASLGADGGGV